MKKIITFLFALVCATTVFSQDMFAGTWKYQTGNEVFILTIQRTTSGYKGHYKKITVDAQGSQITVIYDSNKPIGNTSYNWPFVISSGDTGQNPVIGGTIQDNTIAAMPDGRVFIEGKFSMRVLNPTCYTPPSNACTLQAQWIVKKTPGIQDPNEPDFNIPKNIVLTKQ